MEHREPPRIAAGDRRFDGAIEEPGGRFRLRRFDPVAQPAPDRLRPRWLARPSRPWPSPSALIYLATRGDVVPRSTGCIVNPSINFRSTQIELVHRASGLVSRRNSRRFSNACGASAREPERISVLDVTPERLALAFKKYAWVDEVVKVAYGPVEFASTFGIASRSRGSSFPTASSRSSTTKGIILPPKMSTWTELGQLIKITGEGLAAPCRSRAGVGLEIEGRAATDIEQVDERILAAAKLAGFLQAEAAGRDAERIAGAAD